MDISKLPWSITPGDKFVIRAPAECGGEIIVASTDRGSEDSERCYANAAFIVNACNLHDQLKRDLAETGAHRLEAVKRMKEAQEEAAGLAVNNALLVKLVRSMEAALVLQKCEAGSVAESARKDVLEQVATMLK